MALRKGLEQHQPEMHHSDQGVQYTANEHVEIFKGVGARMSMAAVEEAWQNGYVERLTRTIKEKEADPSEYRNFAETSEQIGELLDEIYSKKRIHLSSLYLTLVEYEMQWHEQQKKECNIKEKSP